MNFEGVDLVLDRNELAACQPSSCNHLLRIFTNTILAHEFVHISNFVPCSGAHIKRYNQVSGAFVQILIARNVVHSYYRIFPGVITAVLCKLNAHCPKLYYT